jgi:hypothetical protein
MKLTFYVPKKIQNHKVVGALVIDAGESNLRTDDVIEIEDGKVGSKVVLLLVNGTNIAENYVAFEFNGTEWVHADLPIFSFGEITQKEVPLSVEEVEKRFAVAPAFN